MEITPKSPFPLVKTTIPLGSLSNSVILLTLPVGIWMENMPPLPMVTHTITSKRLWLTVLDRFFFFFFSCFHFPFSSFLQRNTLTNPSFTFFFSFFFLLSLKRLMFIILTTMEVATLPLVNGWRKSNPRFLLDPVVWPILMATQTKGFVNSFC